MPEQPLQNLLQSSSHQSLTTKRKRNFFWIIPVLVLVMYLFVIITFFGLQKTQQNNVFFISDIEAARQKLLTVFLIIMSITIVISLLIMWHFTRIRNKAESALYMEAAFRRAMENSMSTGMRVLDLQGRIVYVNPAFCRIIGWNESDLLGKAMPYPYWRKGYMEEHERILDILLTGKTPSSGLEIEAIRRDGSLFTARMYVSPLRDSNGNQIGWMTSMTDITEPKRVRQALTATHERFMTVLEGLDDAISVTVDSPKGAELLFANRTYRRFFGSDAKGHKDLLQAYNNRINNNEIEFYNADTDTWFEVQHRTLTWTDNRKVRMQVARDITDKRKYEDKLKSQQEKVELNSRLTTMGEMASSLAHELNQPLTAIINYNTAISALLKSNKINQERLKEVLERSAEQASRAGKIISRIREFVKRSEPQRLNVSIETIINNTMDLAIIESRKHDIKIDTHVPSNLPSVYADPILIEQVLLNLVKNGIEAMSKESTYRTLHVNVMQIGSELNISVIDRGHGLDDLSRLFEPFFSTKKEGLGMGLNICRTIIESHQGRLWAEHNPEGGTIFQFRLPCAKKNMQDTENT